jgi:hypothetical protein
MLEKVLESIIAELILSLFVEHGLLPANHMRAQLSMTIDTALNSLL